MGMGHLWLNRWGIYDLMGRGSYGKVSCCFFGNMLTKKKSWSL